MNFGQKRAQKLYDKMMAQKFINDINFIYKEIDKTKEEDINAYLVAGLMIGAMHLYANRFVKKDIPSTALKIYDIKKQQAEDAVISDSTRPIFKDTYELLNSLYEEVEKNVKNRTSFVDGFQFKKGHAEFYRKILGVVLFVEQGKTWNNIYEKRLIEQTFPLAKNQNLDLAEKFYGVYRKVTNNLSLSGASKDADTDKNIKSNIKQ